MRRAPGAPAGPTKIRRASAGARKAATDRFAKVQDRRGVREALETYRCEQRAGAALLAGGLAYRLFLWLVPFGLVIAGIASFWVRSSPDGLQHTVRNFGIGGVAARSAAAAVEDGSRARWYLLLFGLALMVWSAISAVRALGVAARVAWNLGPGRLRHPLQASAGFTAIALAGFATSVITTWVRHRLGALGVVLTVADTVVFALLALVALSHLPHPADVTWRAMWPGAVLVGVGLNAVQAFVAYFLAARLERAPHLYGALGASTVVLLVLFLVARLFVAALFLNAAARIGSKSAFVPGDG